jgi:protein-S-isoprenylcysteine O-methyltransferase Ste14
MAQRAFVWLGGALFVGSLAYCAWWFLVALARPPFDVAQGRPVDLAQGARGAIDWTALAVDAGLITIFALHHSVFARERIKARVARAIPPALVRSFYVWVASALLILVCLLWLPIGGELYRAAGWRAIAHAAVQLAGVALIAQSVRGIDPLELAGIRAASARGPLQVRGPYALVRHPLYLGWVLALFAAAHMTGDRLAFAAITTIYLLLAIPWEERSLTDSFGDDYRRYCRAVRWRIFPFIY